jgi:hypothetical protein
MVWIETEATDEQDHICLLRGGDERVQGAVRGSLRKKSDEFGLVDGREINPHGLQPLLTKNVNVSIPFVEPRPTNGAPEF